MSFVLEGMTYQIFILRGIDLDKVKWLFQGLSFVISSICFVGFQDGIFLIIGIVNAVMIEGISRNEAD